MENERRQREYAVLLIAAVLFLITLVATIVVLSGDDDEPVPSPSPEPSVTFAPEPTVTPSPSIEPSIVLPPVLASGQDEDFVFDVINVERDVSATTDGQVAEGALTLVTLMVENVGDEPLGFSPSDVGALDPTGVLWMSDNLDESDATVIPGGSIEEVVVFDIAVGVNLTAIVATGSSAGAVATEGGVEIPLP